MICSDYKLKYVFIGKKLIELSNVVENYYVVLIENRKFFNEFQELKGIEVYDKYFYLICQDK